MTQDQSNGRAWLGLKLNPPGGPKQKAQAAAVALLLLVGGFVANKALETASDNLFPDSAKIKAETLQENISDKVQSIELLSEKIHAGLSNLDAETSEAIERDTRNLMTAIESLRPDILAAQALGNDAARQFADAKLRDLSKAGFSTSADFVIPTGGGATVCSDGYVFGTGPSNIGNEIRASLSGPEGRDGPHSISPGQSVRVETNRGLVQVSLQDIDVNGSGQQGFSVNCP